MKHILSFSILSIALLVAACTVSEYDDSQIKKDIAELQQRMTDLETRVNSNIASLTEIVTALQQNDYLLSYSPYVEDRVQVGWQLNFAKSGSIIVYFGKDGKDGADGTPGADGAPGADGTPGKDGKDGKDGHDGADGHTPLISVRQDTDGIWYWTLDGEWLLDASGAKVKAVGIDGKDGKDGVDGKDGKDGVDGKDGQDGLNGGRDGVDGKDGKDGITPLLKIEEGYWYLSLDNGQSWDNVGKATGDNGKDGKDGNDGKDGVTIFKSVTEDDNNLYLTLTDDTVIAIPKSVQLEVSFNPERIVLKTGVLTNVTYEITSSVTPVKVSVVSSADIKAKVIPADASGLTGTIMVVSQRLLDEFSQIIILVENGEKVLTRVLSTETGELEDSSTGEINGYIWVDLGLPSGLKWATSNVGATVPEEYGDYFAWGETEPKNNYNWSTYKFGGQYTLTKYCANSSYGTVDYKTTLELADDAALANWGGSWRTPTDPDWAELLDNCTWSWVSRNGVKGKLVTGPNGNSIFLPAAGYMVDDYSSGTGSEGRYWSSSLYTEWQDLACSLSFDSGGAYRSVSWRYNGASVRPVSGEGASVSVSSISLDQDVIALKRHESASLTATVTPANATQPTVNWSSSNSKVAMVDKDGNVTALAIGSATITATTFDGGYSATCNVTVLQSTEGTINGYEWVDLGLPSGLLWATCNVGATAQEEYGDYFAWGENRPKSEYNWFTYIWCFLDYYDSLDKYNNSDSYGTVDNKTTLELKDDAARAIWGGSWRMPTGAEWTELIKQCTWTWTTQNGVNGRLVTGPNGKSIFLPAAGFWKDTSYYSTDTYGCYWSSSLYTDKPSLAYYVDFTSNHFYCEADYRCDGLSVRPVSE